MLLYNSLKICFKFKTYHYPKKTIKAGYVLIYSHGVLKSIPSRFTSDNSIHMSSGFISGVAKFSWHIQLACVDSIFLILLLNEPSKISSKFLIYNKTFSLRQKYTIRLWLQKNLNIAYS